MHIRRLYGQDEHNDIIFGSSSLICYKTFAKTCMFSPDLIWPQDYFTFDPILKNYVKRKQVMIKDSAILRLMLTNKLRRERDPMMTRWRPDDALWVKRYLMCWSFFNVYFLAWVESEVFSFVFSSQFSWKQVKSHISIYQGLLQPPLQWCVLEFAPLSKK